MSNLNLDSISLNDIFNGLQKQKDNFNLKEMDRTLHIMYPNKLAKYVLVSPYEVDSQIDKGCKIRYIKKNTNTISCAASVVKIVKPNKLTGDGMYLLLTMVVNRKPVWKIYTSDHFIFIHNHFVSDDKTRRDLEDKFKTMGKSYDLFETSKQTRHKLFKHAGLVQKDIDLDNKIDNMFECHQNRPKKEYTGLKVSTTNVDFIVDNIINHEKVKTKNKKKKTKKRKK